MKISANLIFALQQIAMFDFQTRLENETKMVVTTLSFFLLVF